mgnify:CR=1 FL=1
MEYIILIIVILFILIIYNSSKEEEKKKERNQERRDYRKQKETEITNRIKTEVSQITDTIFVWKKLPKLVVVTAFDKVRMKLIVIDNQERLFALNKGEILKCELRTNSKTISTGQTTKKGTIPRAVIGGVLAGGAGAIVGGMSSKEKHKTTTRKYSSYFLDFYTSNPDLPFVTLSGWETELRKWYGYILPFIDIDKKESKVKISSVADELIKLKALLDSEVITQIEFDNEKNRLLKR